MRKLIQEWKERWKDRYFNMISGASSIFTWNSFYVIFFFLQLQMSFKIHMLNEIEERYYTEQIKLPHLLSMLLRSFVKN